MKKKFAVILISTLIPFYPVSYHRASAETESVAGNIYTEIVLEDFENNTRTEYIILSRGKGKHQAEAVIEEDYPAPVKGSTGYLDVKVYGGHGDTYRIVPGREISIEMYCKSVELWVYGKNFPGELSILVQDASQNTHSFAIGRLDFLGWRKIKVTIPNKVTQHDQYLHQRGALRILGFQYRLLNKKRTPEWQYFYIDHITAVVRDKYKARGKEDW